MTLPRATCGQRPRHLCFPERIALADLDLFAGTSAADLDELAARLHPVRVDPGTELMHQGDTGTTFVLILDGDAAVVRDGEEVGDLGRGSIVGELAILRGEPRTATVTARTEVSGLEGDAAAFAALCDASGVRERLARIAAQRLAANATPVPAVLPDGTGVTIRPVLPSDLGNLVDALEHMSLESQRLRFFSPGRPSEALVKYLVDVDYVNHFAWVVMTADQGPGIASARYIRLHDRPHVAEIALGVRDSHQGRGVGTLLLGALAAAAPVAGVTHFQANVLSENAPMRALLDRFGVHWRFAEPGVVATEFDLAPLRGLLDEATADALEAAARVMVHAASLALA